ncbi:PAS domain S-box-containing protein [Flavobacteriaceae bacterium MAR_2010_72]|nr:PAS domain S-box-containing protein [Flavobacteriaceae bacterium MAR_2010_72]TVZ57986.1 PAS domain S-box-containing protein [Flavobacteriaceae bacterium MAR_2010_105]
MTGPKDRNTNNREYITNDKFFVKLFHNTLTPKSLSNLSDRKLVDVNEAWEQFTGYSKKEVIGFKVEELNLINFNEADQIREQLDKTKIIKFFEVELKVKGDKLKYGYASFQYFEIDGAKYVQTTLLDITELKEAQEKVRLAKEFSEKLILSLRPGLVVMNIQGEITDVNPSFCKITRFTKEELIGTRAPFPFWPPESYEAIQLCLQKTLQGELGNFEFLFMRKDGERFPASLATSSIKNNQGEITAFFVTIDDITEQKNAEERLVNSEKYLDNIINNIGDPLFVKDDQSRLLLVNDAFCNIFNLKKEDIIGKTLAEDVPPDEREIFLHIDNQVLATGIENVNEETLTVAGLKTRYISTKKTRFLDEDGNKFLIGVIRDVTERKKAEDKIRESELNLRQSQIVANIGSYAFDFKTMTWTSSEVMEKILGIDEFYERTIESWIRLIHPDDRELMLDYFENNVLKHHKKFDKEYRIVRPSNDKTYWLHCLGELVFDDSGTPTKMIGTTQDITERKKAEIELKLAYAELEQLRGQLEYENIYLRNEIDLVFNYEEMVYGSEVFSHILTDVEKVAATNATVLLLGESGTGKELLARAIHNISSRANKPLIKVNCAAIPRELIESELFGHVKGAFTGAISDKVGKVELADKGTLFLDEIGELPLEMQPKLLRFLQEGEIEKVGSSKSLKVDVRIIAATNRKLKEEVKLKRFREDLYFRLNVFPIEVPPLRQRSEDIPLLIEHFANKFSKAYGKEVTYISDKAMQEMLQYRWPGNIRELENLIERAVILSNNKYLVLPDFDTTSKHKERLISSAHITLDDVQRAHITKILEKCNWKIEGETGASVLLNIKPSTLRDRMKKLGIKKSK